MASRRRTVVALQRLLAGEHAAIYGYGVAGARLAGPSQTRAVRAFTAHRVQRDALETLLRGRGAQPVPAEATYALPGPVGTRAEAVALAALLEQRLAAVYADAVAELDGELRELAAVGLRDAAVRAARWSSSSTAFPGLPERAR